MSKLFDAFLIIIGVAVLLYIFFTFCKAICNAIRNSTTKDRLIMCGTLCGFFISALSVSTFYPVTVDLIFDWVFKFTGGFSPFFDQLRETTKISPSITEIILAIILIVTSVFFLELFTRRVIRANLKHTENQKESN